MHESKLRNKGMVTSVQLLVQFLLLFLNNFMRMKLKNLRIVETISSVQPASTCILSMNYIRVYH